jgi:hypothetical protein
VADVRLLLALGLLAVAAAPAQTAVIPLPAPTPPTARTDALALLGPDANGDLPSHAPGPVDDEEVVRVGLGPTGEVHDVRVDQRLTVHGVGDFDMKVLGPVRDVVGPEDASPRPGLRSGAVIWQGFSPGAKVLASTITLDPESERSRLPLTVQMGAGQAVVANATATPLPLSVGATEPAALRSAVSAVRAKLAAGQAPVAGADGLPESLPAKGPVTVQSRVVRAPLHLVGSLGSTPFDVVLGDQPVTLHGDGPLRLTATAALPPPSALPDGTAVLDLAVVLAQSARAEEYKVYAGVTVPGPSTARFEYGPAAQAEPEPEPITSDGGGVDVASVVLGALAALLLAGVAAAAWSRS